MRQTLSAEERIKSKKLFGHLFEGGRALTSYPLKLVYLPLAQTQSVPFKIAVTAPKRNFKSAVERNHIKRLMREAYRLNKYLIFNSIQGNFALVFLYLGKEMPSYQSIESKMILLLEKFIEKQLDEKNH